MSQSFTQLLEIKPNVPKYLSTYLSTGGVSMTLPNYREQILRIRSKYGEAHIDNTRANFLWSVYKDIPDNTFNKAIDTYLSDQSKTLETWIDISIDEEKESEKEEIKQTYIKPKFEAPTEIKPKVYCCDYGHIIAKQKETGALYVFKCNCLASRYANQNYPTWENQNGFEKVS